MLVPLPCLQSLTFSPLSLSPRWWGSLLASAFSCWWPLPFSSWPRPLSSAVSASAAKGTTTPCPPKPRLAKQAAIFIFRPFLPFSPSTLLAVLHLTGLGPSCTVSAQPRPDPSRSQCHGGRGGVVLTLCSLAWWKMGSQRSDFVDDNDAPLCGLGGHVSVYCSRATLRP